MSRMDREIVTLEMLGKVETGRSETISQQLGGERLFISLKLALLEDMLRRVADR